jgi:MEMO1 family protein
MRGCVCPHPPLLIAEIGGAHRDRVAATLAGMQRLSVEVGEPDCTVVISPHTAGSWSAFTVKTAPRLSGDFGQFGVSRVGLSLDNDLEFSQRLIELASDMPLALEPSADADLDHGVLVPLSFLSTRRLVSLSVAERHDAHVALGELVRRCADDLGRDVLFVASGDLSHRLIPSAPAGFDERAAEFDHQVVAHLERGDFAGLTSLAPDLVRRAGECGLRSILALGAFLGDDALVSPRVLSYEGPFGVGYAVAAYGAPVTP